MARGTELVLTCAVGLVSFRGHAGHAAAHVVHRNHPKLVVDVRREAENGRVDAPGVSGVVMPHARLEPVFLKLDNVVWESGWRGRVKGSAHKESCPSALQKQAGEAWGRGSDGWADL